MEIELNKGKKSRNYHFRNYKKGIYIAIKHDIEKFIACFEKKDSYDYVDFADVWQSLNFTFVFAGERFNKLLRFFLDSAFSVAKKYIMYTSDDNIAICAFYLLYGLYYMQPIEDMVRIRLCIDEYKKIDHLIHKMCDKGQYDAVYIFMKMRVRSSFDFVVHPHPLFVTSRPNQQYTENDTTLATKADRLIKKVDKLLEDETIVKFEKTNREHEKKLKKYIENNPNCGLNPPSGQSSLTEELKMCLDTPKKEEEPSTSSQLDIRQKIKMKAYQQVQEHFRMKQGSFDESD